MKKLISIFTLLFALVAVLPEKVVSVLAPIVGHRVLLTILFGGYAASEKLGAFLGSIAASVAGNFTVTYVPQFLYFTATTVPTNFQIELDGEPMLMSLDGTGLTAMTHIRQQARVTNTYVFQLANGQVPKKGIISITNAQASTLNIYGMSQIKRGDLLCQYSRISALAGAQEVITDFAYAAFPSAAAADKFQIAYSDTQSDNLTREEVQATLGYTQGDIASKYNVDNINPPRISKIYFTPVAGQTVYQMSYRLAG